MHITTYVGMVEIEGYERGGDASNFGEGIEGGGGTGWLGGRFLSPFSIRIAHAYHMWNMKERTKKVKY